MNKITSPASFTAAHMKLQANLIGHLSERLRINPAAPGAGIKVAHVSAKMLGTVRELGAGKR